MSTLVRNTGAQIGLLAFAVALVAGIQAGNPVTVVLARAMGALFMGAMVGQGAGLAAKHVLREHLQRRKLAIDKAHLAAMRDILDNAEVSSAGNTPEEMEVA